jgi:hypothetical protein
LIVLIPHRDNPSNKRKSNQEDITINEADKEDPSKITKVGIDTYRQKKTSEMFQPLKVKTGKIMLEAATIHIANK